MWICNCGKSFEKRGSLNTHARFCKDYVKVPKKVSKYKIKSGYLCECGKLFEKPQSLNAHFSYCKIHRNGKSLTRTLPGYCGWNRGLTKETNLSVAIQAIQLKGRSSSTKGRKHTAEAKRKMSISAIARLHNDESHCKWYSVFNGIEFIKVQGTWEKHVAERLTALSEFWIRIKIPYDNGNHHYVPDFFLPHRNLYIEVKGWWKDRDIKKVQSVLKENNIDLRILDSKDEIIRFENGNLSIENFRNFDKTVLS